MARFTSVSGGGIGTPGPQGPPGPPGPAGVANIISTSESSRTLYSSDKDSYIFFSNQMTVTVTSSFEPGNSVTFVQEGPNPVSFVASGGTTITSRNGLLSSGGQGTAVTLVCKEAGIYYLLGSLG